MSIRGDSMENLMIKIDDVEKQYRLGVIGGGTLQGDIQSWLARRRGKEDPNSKIGAKEYRKNEKFLALDGVSFEVRKGERVGIIGHNGAGKSTLLKLLSRVTAPTRGQIFLNGRVTSMLEVGTGFHGELTGRENIYMNGAILGMNKKEIDEKIDDIIDFSECRQFIDTPVKRYSSGMYVKLAFSVAAHLDSEIMIMDEVLAVGDMAFQKKCLDKMNQVSKENGRTILYVSHNMNTIRTLCDRCIVLNKGRVIYDGDVNRGIEIYFDRQVDNQLDHDFSAYPRPNPQYADAVKLVHLSFLDRDDMVVKYGQDLKMEMTIDSKAQYGDIRIRFEVQSLAGELIGVAFSELLPLHEGSNKFKFKWDMNILAPGEYTVLVNFSSVDGRGNEVTLDHLLNAFSFSIDEFPENRIIWNTQYWGKAKIGQLEMISV